MLFTIIFFSLIYGSVFSATTPPPGCIVVSPSRFVSSVGPIQRAINSLKGQTGPKVIFIRPGKYVENLVITYKDPLTIIGFSRKETSFAANEVSIVVNTTAISKNSTSLRSGILVRKNDFVMKSINITNLFAQRGVALMAEGSQHAYRACSFSGVQHTLFVKSGAQYFESCNVEGSSDVIMGGARSWFESCTIGVRSSKTQQIIASNRRLNIQDPSAFIFNKCSINNIGNFPGRSIFLGRAWGPFARIIYQSCNLPPTINPAGWMPFATKEVRVNDVTTFVEIENKGTGAVKTGRKFLSPPPAKPVETTSLFSGVNVNTWFYELSYSQAPTVVAANPPATVASGQEIPVVTSETTEFTNEVTIYMPQFVPVQPKIEYVTTTTVVTQTEETTETVQVEELPPPV